MLYLNFYIIKIILYVILKSLLAASFGNAVVNYNNHHIRTDLCYVRK
jgi:hypothetical protein